MTPEVSHEVETGSFLYASERLSIPGGVAWARCSCGKWEDTQGFSRTTGGPVAERLVRARWSNHVQGVPRDS